MAVIGLFRPTRTGGWEGRIRTLTLNLRALIEPNDNRRSDSSPDFLVSVSGCQIGAGWRRDHAVSAGRFQLSVQLDDPCLPKSIFATLISDGDLQSAKLFWTAKKQGVEIGN